MQMKLGIIEGDVGSPPTEWRHVATTTASCDSGFRARVDDVTELCVAVPVACPDFNVASASHHTSHCCLPFIP